MARITPQQGAAIGTSVRVGRKLQDDFPEIAKDYRGDLNKRDIVEKYDLSTFYGVSKQVAYVAVGYAIRGSPGFGTLKPYDGLITDASELEELCSKHILNSNLAQGITPWTDKERDFVYTSSKKPEYRQKTGKRRIFNSLIAIKVNKRFHGDGLIRNPGTIHSFLVNYKKVRGKWIRNRG